MGNDVLLNKKKVVFDPAHDCAVCRNNRGVKRWKFWFSYNRSAFVCAPCASRFQSTGDIISWLESNAIYSKPNAKLIDFKVKECEENFGTSRVVLCESMNHWKSKSERNHFASHAAEQNSSHSRNTFCLVNKNKEV